MVQIQGFPGFHFHGAVRLVLQRQSVGLRSSQGFQRRAAGAGRRPEGLWDATYLFVVLAAMVMIIAGIIAII